MCSGLYKFTTVKIMEAGGGVVNEMKGSVRATYTKTYNDSNDLP